MKKIIIAFLLFFGLWITGCDQNEPPPNVIEEETYVDIMVEMQLLRSYIEMVPSDSTTIDSLHKEIYSKYNINNKQFRRSHEYYQDHYVNQKERIDKAIERLRMDQVESDSTRPWERNNN
jgi:hypothetical protein